MKREVRRQRKHNRLMQVVDARSPDMHLMSPHETGLLEHPKLFPFFREPPN